MATLRIETELQRRPELVTGTLMLFNEEPAMIVVATGPINADGVSFPGVCLDDGVFMEEWDVAQFTVFKGTLSLTQ